MYIYMSNSKLKLTCHKLSPMAAHWRQGQSFFFLLAELPLSLASVNRCENRIAFTLDTLIPRCAFLLFPSLCVLRLFHRICIPQALHAVAQFPTILQRLWTRSLCIACLSDIDTCFLYLTPTIWFSALFPLLILDEADTLTFSVAKLVQATLYQVPVPYYLNYFKNIFVWHHPKNFSVPRWNNSVIPCLPAFLANSDSNVKNKCFTSRISKLWKRLRILS